MTRELPGFSPDDLAWYMPIWCQGYMEVKDLAHRWNEFGWLMQLADSDNATPRPASEAFGPALPVAEQFNRIIKLNFGLTGRELMTGLMGEHFALGWGGPVFRDQFGLICRIKGTGVVGKLLTAARAEPQVLTTAQSRGRGNIRIYKLKFSNLQAAVINDDLFILATTGAPHRTSMFASMVELAKQVNTFGLPRYNTFRAAVRSIPPDYTFRFVILTTVSRPADRKVFEGTLFGELQKSVTFISLAGLPRAKGMAMQLTVQPQSNDPAFLPDRPLHMDTLLRSVFADRTDFVYSAVVNPGQWYRHLAELADQGIIDARQYLTIINLAMPNPQLREKVIGALGPELTVIVSSDKPSPTTEPSPASQPAAGPPALRPVGSLPAMPRMALLVRTGKPAETIEAVDQVFRMLCGFLTLQNLASGSTGMVGQIDHESYRNKDLHRLTIDRYGPTTEASARPEPLVDLTWTLAGPYLLIGNSAPLVHALIDRAASAQPASMPTTQAASDPDDSSHWVMSFDPSRTAVHVKDLTRWLSNFWPAVGGEAGTTHDNPFRIGIYYKPVKPAGQNRTVVQVVAVLPGHPAWHRLRIDDTILAVDDIDLDPTTPSKDLNAKVARVVEQGRNLKIRVLRAGKTVELEIPTARFNPVVTPRAARLLCRLLNAAGREFIQTDLACTYAQDGQIRLLIELNPRRQITGQAAH